MALARARNKRKRDFAWDELARDAAGSRVACAKVAETWNFRSKQEHLAVGAFSLIAHELAEEGCDPVVLALVTRAANDEVRHADLCARMWAALRGERCVAARFAGTPSLPQHDSLQSLLHVVEICCISETFTGVAFTEMLARTTHPVAHAVVQSLLADELDHGRVGWAYMAERAKSKTLDGLSDLLPDVFVRAMSPGMRPAELTAESDDPALERWGYLGPKTIATIFRDAARDVVLPGFEHFGVDTTKTVAALAANGWT